MSNRSNRPKKYATKFKAAVSEVKFNLAQMVHNYALSKRLMGLFEQTVDDKGDQIYPESSIFFSGIIRGYDDWFSVLSVDQDKFDTVFARLDKHKVIGDADAIYARTIEQKVKRKKEQNRIIIPGRHINEKDISVIKHIFDQQATKIGGK